MLLPSTRTDGVTAYDAETGAEVWRYTTDGPVRFAPAVGGDRAYIASDDGYLHCVSLHSGSLLWKVRGGPSDRKILGNERLISTWPVRGAPAVADGVVYFAAGIWPFMGVFLHAVDAETGDVIWTSDGDGSTFMKQPHQAEAFAGVAPQGRLVVRGDRLLVPGRSVAACYDRRTGKLLHYQLADSSKKGGGSTVTAADGVFLNGSGVFDLVNGDYLGPAGDKAVLSGDRLYTFSRTELTAFRLPPSPQPLSPTMGERGWGEGAELVDRKAYRSLKGAWQPVRLGSLNLPRVEVLAKGGNRLYVGAENQVFAVDLPLGEGKSTVSWAAPINGRPAHIVAGGGRLYVSTREGRVYCFGGDEVKSQRYPLPAPQPPRTDEWTERTRQLVRETGVTEGYGVVWGVGSGRLIAELLRQTNLRLIVLEPDRDRAQAFRTRQWAKHLYGDRVSVIVNDGSPPELPPYLASLMTAEAMPAEAAAVPDAWFRRAVASLRPFGGVACLPVAAEDRPLVADTLVAAGLSQANLREANGWLLIARDGPLPGSANWTHEHGDAANTRVSPDQLVKAPLGLLWFGGPSNDAVLPRHGHGPQPQVIDGRLLIEGVDLIRAIDIYTGRLLWEARLPGVGKPYDVLPHQAGANAGGSNFVSAPDGIYVAVGNSCVRLDPATGERLREFALPKMKGEKAAPRWSYVNVVGDYLLGGANPAGDDRKVTASCQRLTVMNRHTGAVLWSATAQQGFRNNGICAGGGRCYAIDRPTGESKSLLKKITEGSKPARLIAFDLKTGRPLWSTSADVFGTWLSYSAKHDVIVEAGRYARDTLADEPKGMRAYRAADGKVLWFKDDYVGPAMLHGDVILKAGIKDGSACELLTGKPVLREDPLTGERIEWTWARTYGCNTPSASEHLLTFRSGAAGYFDLCHDGGTGNLGGFRSSCTNNLIVAGGLLTAPDYTRNCTCSYQNQTSAAFVPTDDAEMWTFFGARDVKGIVKRVGVNLGAPGNRKADDGTLWLEYPTVGGPSPRLEITTVPAKPETFRRHTSQVTGAGPSWVGASGVRGLEKLTIRLGPDGSKPRPYTVRLHFAEPDKECAAGDRVFDVALQGKTVLRDFDIVAEAGAPLRGVVKEFKGVMVSKELTVKLTPSESARVSAAVLCGVEIVAE